MLPTVQQTGKTAVQEPQPPGVRRDDDESFVSANGFDCAPRNHVGGYRQFRIEVESPRKAILLTRRRHQARFHQARTKRGNPQPSRAVFQTERLTQSNQSEFSHFVRRQAALWDQTVNTADVQNMRFRAAATKSAITRA